jgi:hypothetical protein
MKTKINWLAIWEFLKPILTLGISHIIKRLKRDTNNGYYTIEQIEYAQRIHEIISRNLDSAKSILDSLPAPTLEMYKKIYPDDTEK